MKGFFPKEDIEDRDAPCLKCKLFKTCTSSKMKMEGKGKKRILIIAEMPGAREDEEGEYHLTSGLLYSVLKKNGISLKKDCWKTSAVCCRTNKGKQPTKSQVKYCHPRLERVLKKKNPKLIILLGSSAVESFINTRLAETIGGINRWRGFIIPDQTYKAWVVSTYTPNHVQSNINDKLLPKIFKRDIVAGLRKLKEKVPIHKHKVEILNEDRACDVLMQLSLTPPPLLSFDYETTGKKPYQKRHKIICVGVCFTYKDTPIQIYSFQLTRKTKELWKQILKDKNIKKTAQNIKFEHLWSRRILKVITKGWVWDTMLAAHILDNRPKVTGLKFQAYINFGQLDYSSHLDKFIKSNDNKGFNNIEDAPIEEVMKYCGLDSILEFKLALKQMEELKNDKV